MFKRLISALGISTVAILPFAAQLPVATAAPAPIASDSSVRFEAFQESPEIVSLALNNGHFDFSSENMANIVNPLGQVVESISTSPTESLLVSPTELLISTDKASLAEQKGFCLIGHNPNGSCRGASKEGARCAAGVVGGAGTGGLGGTAIAPGWGTAVGGVAGAATGAATFCFN